MNERRLRVGLVVGEQPGGGIARYCAELTGALLERDDVDVVPIGSAASLSYLREQLGNGLGSRGKVVVGSSNQLGDALLIRYHVGLRLASARLEVLHCTKHLVPLGSPVPSVLTVHDLTVLERRDEFPLAKRLLLPRWYFKSLHEASQLVAVSHAIARRVCERFAELAHRTTPVPLAVPRSAIEGEKVPVGRLVGAQFALAVGDISPRKNFLLLAHIWDSVFELTGLQLVIAGRPGWNSGPVHNALDELAQRGRAVKLGRVSDAELRWLYSTAKVCCVPSLEEGYGLPVSEALALGCPVVASPDPALVEGGDGRATHVPCDDPPAWIEAIHRVSKEGQPVTHEGPLRSWQEVAAETMRVYRRAARKSGNAP